MNYDNLLDQNYGDHLYDYSGTDPSASDFDDTCDLGMKLIESDCIENGEKQTPK